MYIRGENTPWKKNSLPRLIKRYLLYLLYNWMVGMYKYYKNFAIILHYFTHTCINRIQN